MILDRDGPTRLVQQSAAAGRTAESLVAHAVTISPQSSEQHDRLCMAGVCSSSTSKTNEESREARSGNQRPGESDGSQVSLRICPVPKMESLDRVRG
jgi:hypothetical protein